MGVLAMSQPQWELVANLGDVDWFEHGGIFVYRDKTGIYDPEIEILHEISLGPRLIDRFVAEKCYFTNGILSDNQYHLDYPVWFASDLESISSFYGYDIETLIKYLCSDDPIERALGYLAVYYYWGIDNLGGDRLELTPFETINRYRHDMKKLEVTV